MAEAVRRISTALSGEKGTLNPDLYSACLRKSFVFSVDQAHAIHPNYRKFMLIVYHYHVTFRFHSVFPWLLASMFKLYFYIHHAPILYSSLPCHFFSFC